MRATKFHYFFSLPQWVYLFPEGEVFAPIILQYLFHIINIVQPSVKSNALLIVYTYYTALEPKAEVPPARNAGVSLMS